jgi:SAM-dependent methyltransferase
VLEELKKKGYSVRGTNYSKHPGTVSGLDIDEGVDILKRLPYDDESFDGVLLCEVMEHIGNHDQAIAEISRICRPGGVVVLTTPNILRLRSRLHLFLTGFFQLKREFIGFDVPVGAAFTFHNYPVHLPVFLYQMRSHGFRLAEFTSSDRKPVSYLLYVLCLPWIFLATALTVHLFEKNLRRTPAATELMRMLTSMDGLCGETAVLVGKKDAATAAQRTALPEWSQTHS